MIPGTLPYIIHKAFGFFFLQYRDRYFWFSIIVLSRRFVISLITSLVDINSVLSFGLNNLVLVVSAVVVLVKRPFRTHIDNLMECATILCAIFVYGMAVLMSVPEFDYGAVVIEVFYFLINILVCIPCLLLCVNMNMNMIQMKHLTHMIIFKQHLTIHHTGALVVRAGVPAHQLPRPAEFLAAHAAREGAA